MDYELFGTKYIPDMLDYIDSNPDCATADIIGFLGMTTFTALRARFDALEEEEYIVCDDSHRPYTYHTTPRGHLVATLIRAIKEV